MLALVVIVMGVSFGNAQFQKGVLVRLPSTFRGTTRGLQKATTMTSTPSTMTTNSNGGGTNGGTRTGTNLNPNQLPFYTGIINDLSCSDSDGGLSPLVAGTVTLKDQRGVIISQNSDSCVNASTVREYVCGGSTRTASQSSIFKDTKCPINTICSNGACKAASEKKLLVVPIYDALNNQNIPPFYAVQQINDAYFNAHDSLSKYYDEETSGMVHFIGDVSAPVGVKMQNYQDAIFNNIHEVIIPTNKVIDYSQYDYYIYLPMDITNPNSGGGYAYEGLSPKDTGNGIRNIALGVMYYLNAWQTGRPVPLYLTVPHEVGHMLGLQHADGWKCNSDIPFTIDQNTLNSCIAIQFDDSLMGGDSKELTLDQRIKLGTSLVKQEVMQSGNYTLTSSSSGLNGIHELTLSGKDGYYFLEYRTTKKNGLIIRFVPNPNRVFQDDSLRMGGKYDFSYQIGDVFSDKLRNISIEVLNLDKDRAFVKVIR